MDEIKHSLLSLQSPTRPASDRADVGGGRCERPFRRGAIAEALDGAPASRISFHLKELEQSGLVESRREGRSIIYSAIFPALSDLVVFLMHDCCQAHCKVCDKAIALFAKCLGRPTPALA